MLILWKIRLNFSLDLFAFEENVRKPIKSNPSISVQSLSFSFQGIILLSDEDKITFYIFPTHFPFSPSFTLDCWGAIWVIWQLLPFNQSLEWSLS